MFWHLSDSPPTTILVLASPVFVDTEVLGNFYCSCSVIFFLHIVLILLLLLLLYFSHRLQFCPDSDEQLRLHGSPQLRCFNHSHCQETGRNVWKERSDPIGNALRRSFSETCKETANRGGMDGSMDVKGCSFFVNTTDLACCV